MLKDWFEKPAAQWGTLAAIVAAMAYYWGWVFDFGYKFDWSVLFTENETYQLHLGHELLRGLGMTVRISLISSAIALFMGITFGLARLSSFRPVRWLANFYVEFFRNTPLLVQLFFWYFAFPMALPENLREMVFELEFEFWSATLGLGIYTGAFMAEVIRAGMQSIPKGLLEAAYSSGLSYFQVLSRIILPLAFRAIIPPLGSEFLNNMKNSSLAMVVGVAELCWHAQQVESLTFKGFEATTAATVLYLSLSLLISAVLNGVNQKLQITPGEKPKIGERIINLACTPVVIAGAGAGVVVTKVRARAAANAGVGANLGVEYENGDRGAFEYSAAMAAWKTYSGATLRLIIQALKIAFVLGMIYILAMTVTGIWNFNWQIIRDNFLTLLIWRFPNGSPNEVLWGLGGLSSSIIMAVIAISVSFFIGLAVGIGRTSRNRLFRIPCMVYIEIIRGNPLIMVIFWVYFFIPVLTKTFLDVFWSATVALTLFTGAYLAEIVRAGIQNIPPGQYEAALSTGLSYWQAMGRIILPQALKQMIPAIVGQFIAIFKDTSLAYVIGVLELTFVAQGLNNRLMIYPFEIFTTVAALYFVCCYSMSVYASRLERRLSPERTRLQM